MPLSIELDSKLIKLTQQICLPRQTLQQSFKWTKKNLNFFAAKDKKKEKERNKEK